MDDIGADNPMVYNKMFALVFVSPYLASDKKIPPKPSKKWCSDLSTILSGSLLWQT